MIKERNKNPKLLSETKQNMKRDETYEGQIKVNPRKPNAPITGGISAACIYLITLLNLTSFTLQQACSAQETSTGFGKLRGFYSDSSTSLRTVDHYGKLRALNPTTGTVTSETDLLAEVNTWLTANGFDTESYIKAVYFDVDGGVPIDSVFISTLRFIFYKDIGNAAAVTPLIPNPTLSEFQQSFVGIGGGYFAALSSDKIVSIVDPLGPTAYSWTLSNPEFFTSITGNPVYLVSDFRRVYATIYPSKIGYDFIVQSTGAYTGAPVTQDQSSDTWTNVTSNIASKLTGAPQDIIAFGVNKTSEAAIRFKTHNLANLHDFTILTPFTRALFDPASDKLLIYFPHGEICIINYADLAGTPVVTEGACHVVITPITQMSFIGTKLLLNMDSAIAVYNYDTDMSLASVFAPQPIFSDQLVGSTDQYHVFPNIKLRKFDTTTKTYAAGDLFAGEVLQARVNPKSTGEIFALVGLNEIKRITISTGAVAATYTGMETTVLGASASDYTDYKLISFDAYKVKDTTLGLLYKVKKASDSSLKYVFIEYDYNANTGTFEELDRTTDGYLNLVRMGNLDSVDAQILGYTDVLKVNKVDGGLGVSKVNINDFIQDIFEFKYNIELIEHTDAGDITIAYPGPTTIAHAWITDYVGPTVDQKKYVFLASYGILTNCLPKTSPVDSSGSPTFPETNWCGGSQILKGEISSTFVFTFVVATHNQVSGAIFIGSDGKTYLQQNEGTRIVYEGDEEECFRNDFSPISVGYKFACNDPDCLICDLDTGHICKQCNTKNVENGLCVDNCASPKYASQQVCVDHCPLFTYKAVDGAARTCESSCAGVAGKTNTFGDICSPCPGGSTASGGACTCDGATLANHDETCIAGTAPTCSSGIYWHHYSMCVDAARDGFTVYPTNQMYCTSTTFVDFTNNKACILEAACVGPRLKGTHPSYGNICVTDTECKTDLSYNKNAADGTCVLTCPAYVDMDTNDCVADCTGKTPYEEGGKKECYTTCPAGTYLDTFNSRCVDTCPTTPATVYTDEVNNQCIGTCADPLIYHPTENKCIAACPTTPTQYYVKVDRTCVTKSACTGSEELFASINDFKCLAACTAPNDHLIPSTLECVATCPTATPVTYTLATNSSCETQTACTGYTTPSQHYAIGAMNTCETACTVGLYKYDVDFTCLTEAGCKGIANYYALADASNSCVDKAGCTTATRFTVDDTDECLATCPTTGTTSTYKYTPGNSCLTAALCRANTGFYTFDSANNECLDTTGCTGKGASAKVVPETGVCETSGCPVGHPFEYATNDACYSQAGCAAISYYTTATGSTCTPTCSTPYTDEANNQCVDTCSSGTFGIAADSICYSIEQCAGQPERWGDATNNECLASCPDKKNHGEALCVASCPGDEDSSSNCYEAFTIDITEIRRNDDNSKLIVEFETSVDSLTLDETIITQIKVTNKTDPALPAEETISTFEFTAGEGQTFSVEFESQYVLDEVEVEFTYNQDAEVFSSVNRPVRPQLYKTSSSLGDTTLAKFIDPNPPLNIPVRQYGGVGAKVFFGFIAAHVILLRTLPLVSPIFTGLTLLNFLPFLLRAFSKLHLYTYFNFQMTQDYDKIYLTIFRDIMELGSRETLGWMSPGILAEDLILVCEKRSWRLCHVGVNFNFLINMLLTLVLLVLTFCLLGATKLKGQEGREAAEKVKTASLPHFWISNQLPLLFTIIYNFIQIRFDNFVFGFSFILALISLIAIILGLVLIIVKRRSEYPQKVLENFTKIFFESKGKAGHYFAVQLLFDLLMVTSILAFQKHPLAQSIIWLVIELILFILIIILKPFKIKMSNARELLKQATFILIAIFIMAINIRKKTSKFLSGVILCLSLLLLSFDFLISIIIYYHALRAKCSKNDGERFLGKFGKVTPIRMKPNPLESDSIRMSIGDKSESKFEELNSKEASSKKMDITPHSQTDHSFGKKLPNLPKLPKTNLMERERISGNATGDIKNQLDMIEDLGLNRVDDVKDSVNGLEAQILE